MKYVFLISSFLCSSFIKGMFGYQGYVSYGTLASPQLYVKYYEGRAAKNKGKDANKAKYGLWQKSGRKEMILTRELFLFRFFSFGCA